MIQMITAMTTAGCRNRMNAVSPGCFLLSTAVSRLEDGMFGGTRRPAAVDKLKKAYPRASIGFGPRREKAAEVIHRAVLTAKLRVYVVSRGEARDSNLGPDEKRSTLRIVTPAVLKILPKTRDGGLPDHAIRVPLSLLRRGLVDEETFAALSSGALVLMEAEFASWYRQEARKGKWPSQRDRKHRGAGRPSKQTATLANKISSIVNANAWSGKGKITDLRRLLVAGGIGNTVSDDTLGRLVDALFRETGDERFGRRSRRKAAARDAIPAKSD
jgi:hypothetical protein